MAIWDLFSKREADAANAGKEDVYQYSVIPPALRVQIQQISMEAFGQVGYHGVGYGNSGQDNPFWLDIEKVFKREKGVHVLGNGTFAAQRVIGYMTDCSTEDWLDLLELICVIIAVSATDNFRQERYDWSIKLEADAAIHEVNYRLRQAAVGFQVEDGHLIKVASQFIHADVVVPALTILREERFGAANEEFRKAHKEFREGDYRDCITDCGKALESVFKVLAAERGWQGVGNNSQLAALIKAAADNGLFASYMPEQINGIKALVQGVGTVRNKDGAHGAGTAEARADEDLAAYQLHQTASALIFIGRRAIATA